MADPTANLPAKRRGNLSAHEYPMDAADMTLYIGQMICNDATGYAVKGLNAASYQFLGVALEKKVQVSAAADGENTIKVQTRGECLLTVTGVAKTDVGKPVFMTDSGACQLTPTEVFVGYVSEYVGTNSAYVELLPGMAPRRFDLTLPIPTSAASSTKTSGLHTFRRKTAILAAYANALVYPDYATSVLDVDKYDLSGTADVAVVDAADIDGETAKTAVDLTVITASSANLCDPGDSVRASQTLGATEAAASDGLAVTLECVEYDFVNQ